MHVPFVDLRAQLAPIRQEIQAALDDVLDSASFVLGDSVHRFEEAFAARHGTRHCVATSCGTSALHLALIAGGVRAGDEVLVPANTFIATAEAVSHCGATPVFVDVREDDLCLDPSRLPAALTRRTRAILPVHLYGQPAEMDPILDFARSHGLVVVEDCAQAHDAEYRGRRVGAFGVAAGFSFYPGKNLGACGEGGCVLTDDDAKAAEMRLLRDHGSPRKYQHDRIGFNYRMHGFQGAILGVKLRYLAEWTARRRELAALYRERLRGLPVQVPAEKGHVRHVYHLFVIRVADRDRVARDLAGEGVATGIHYPTPIHRTGAYAHLGQGRGSCPVAERAAEKVLSLPIYAEMTQPMIEHVVGALERALSGGRGGQ